MSALVSLILSVMVISGILEVEAKPVAAGDELKKVLEQIKRVSEGLGTPKVSSDAYTDL